MVVRSSERRRETFMPCISPPLPVFWCLTADLKLFFISFYKKSRNFIQQDVRTNLGMVFVCKPWTPWMQIASCYRFLFFCVIFIRNRTKDKIDKFQRLLCSLINERRQTKYPNSTTHQGQHTHYLLHEAEHCDRKKLCKCPNITQHFGTRLDFERTFF